MTEQEIIEAWLEIRKTNNTIPDNVLNFMKESALKELKKVKVTADELFQKFDKNMVLVTFDSEASKQNMKMGYLKGYLELGMIKG